MNKAFYRNKVFFSSILIGCLILFNLSCGLDTIYIIEPPKNIVNTPSYNSTDDSFDYFAFYTNETENGNSEIIFLGTDVYYKIYRNTSKLDSECSNILSLVSKDDNSSANSMQNTYNFQPLRVKNRNDDILIPRNTKDQRVFIRLSDLNLQDDSDDTDKSNVIVTLNDNNIFSEEPIRNLPYISTFNFKAGENDNTPKDGDVDTSYTGQGIDSEWYVAMFAVSVGRDASYVKLFSNVAYLGSVKILVK